MFRVPARDGKLCSFSRKKEMRMGKGCLVSLRVLALGDGGEGLGFGNVRSCTESSWSSCLRSL